MVVIHVPSGVRIAMTAPGALTSLNVAAAARFSASVVAGARPSSTRVGPPPWTEAPDVVAAASPDELSSLPHAAAVEASVAARTIAATLLVRTGSATLVPRSPPILMPAACSAVTLRPGAPEIRQSIHVRSTKPVASVDGASVAGGACGQRCHESRRLLARRRAI